MSYAQAREKTTQLTQETLRKAKLLLRAGVFAALGASAAILGLPYAEFSDGAFVLQMDLQALGSLAAITGIVVIALWDRL